MTTTTVVFCVLSTDPNLTAFPVEVNVDVTDRFTVGSFKEAVYASRMSRLAGVRASDLTLVRMSSGSVGGLLPEELAEELAEELGASQEGLSLTLDQFGLNPEDKVDCDSVFSPARGAYKNRDGLLFKVMNSMELVSVYTRNLPPRRHHVLILLPIKATPQRSLVASIGRTYLFKQLHSLELSDQGIDYRSPLILSRDSVTTSIIKDYWNASPVILFKSTPMTGKSSMATLLAHRLNNDLRDSNTNVIIIKFSVAQLCINDCNWRFQESFDSLFDFTWATLLDAALAGVKVFLIIDDAHLMYSEKVNPRSSPHPCQQFWTVIRAIGSYNNCISIAMFSAYGFESLESVPPVELPRNTIFKLTGLTDDEVKEYFTKNYSCSQALNTEETNLVALNLRILVGNHTGLICAAVSELNKLNTAQASLCDSQLTGIDLVSAIWSEKMYTILKETRAVNFLKNFNIRNLRDALVENRNLATFVRQGVLVEHSNRFGFSSNIIFRFFMELLYGEIKMRSLVKPRDVNEMVELALGAVNYEILRSAYTQSGGREVVMRRVLQMELYKAFELVTPATFSISPDIGKWFGDTGLFDFAIHADGSIVFWGIELCCKRRELERRLGKLGVGTERGIISQSSANGCVIDFRERRSGQDWQMDDIDMSERLMIVMRDSDFSYVVVHYFLQGVKVIRKVVRLL
ncbi:hypothetical protein HDU79_003940 [Rhizoclosmatium sp. JEL0117]|nr:hypothetical protein HDU79_003940 [Rhizoclosmatium sp. JEL0117]